MSRLCIICILLCATIISKAQSNSGALEGDDLLKALTECERRYFFSTDPIERNNVLIEKAEIYKQSADYDKAILTLERLQYQWLGDSLEAYVSTELALCAYLAGRFKEAIAFSDNTLQITKDSDIARKHEVYLIKVLANNELKEYEKAHEAAINFVKIQSIPAVHKDSILMLLSEIYHPSELPRFRNPDRAEYLSTFFPGLGQCYAGYCLEGAGSLLIHLALASITGYAVYKTYYLTSYFGGISLLMRFYFGGPRRSAYLAEKNNYKNKVEFSEKVRAVISGI